MLHDSLDYAGYCIGRVSATWRHFYEHDAAICLTRLLLQSRGMVCGHLVIRRWDRESIKYI